MIFDAELGAMVRDPKYANSTASEILATHKEHIADRLIEDEYEEATLSLKILAGVVSLIGALVVFSLWPA